MFNIGGGELLVILLIGLIVLGPQKLPEAARQVGAIAAQLRRISAGFQSELKSALDDPVEAAARDRGRQVTTSEESPAPKPQSTAAAAGMYDASTPAVDDAPQDTAPEEAAPEETAPEETAPEEAAPQDTGAAEAPGDSTEAIDADSDRAEVEDSDGQGAADAS